jgi:hypothetical protein
VDQDGKQMIQLRLSHDMARLEIWFDPEVNCLIRKVRVDHHPKSGNPRLAGTREVTQFREVASGTYFPEQVLIRGYRDDRLYAALTTTFSNFRVNQPFGTGAFKLPIPYGMSMADTIQEKVYKVDSEGKNIGPATNEKGDKLEYAKDAPLSAAPSSQGHSSQTTEESRPWTFWLLPTGLLAFVVAGCVWLIQRRKAYGR